MLSFNVSSRSRSNKVQIDLTVTRIHSDIAMGERLNVLHNYTTQSVALRRLETLMLHFCQ